MPISPFASPVHFPYHLAHLNAAALAVAPDIDPAVVNTHRHALLTCTVLDVHIFTHVGVGALPLRYPEQNDAAVLT